jgi:hypothetical protein
MGEFLKVNGDYNIKTPIGNRVTVDTGPGVGELRVTGNLIVEGDTLTISAANLDVVDNIITVNNGETGAGVTLTYAGIRVDRGIAATGDSFLLYNENSDAWIIAGGTEGSYNFEESRLVVNQILTEPTAANPNGDLNLISTGAGVLSVLGTTNYELNVTSDDDIPNKKYVDEAVQNNPTYQILRGNTRVVAFDTSDALDLLTNFPPSIGPYASQPVVDLISIVVDNDINAVFYKTYATIQTLQYEDNEILAINVDDNIVMTTQGTGKLETNYALQLTQRPTPPTYVSSASLIYAADPDIGTSGVYFVNDSANTYYQQGELISKNKAVLFSMIF